MMKPLALALSVIGFATVQSFVSVPTADAKIVCKDGFQNSSGNWISTPYCNDALLARVARESGVKVSDNEVRENPAKKYELCRFIGSDPRVRNYCPDEGSSGRR